MSKPMLSHLDCIRELRDYHSEKLADGLEDSFQEVVDYHHPVVEALDGLLAFAEGANGGALRNEHKRVNSAPPLVTYCRSLCSIQ